MAVNNNTILAKAYLSGTNDYQQRVGNPAQAGIDRVVKRIFDPMNGDVYNQFVSFLVNRIGAAYAHQKRWENPLKFMVKPRLEFGSTEQEYALNWVKAHSYDMDSEELLRFYKPDGEAAYHSMNRQEYYPITIQRTALRQAFTSEYGLNEYVASQMIVPMNSDENDTYNIMVQLIAEYEQNWRFFKRQVEMPEDTATATALLKQLQADAGHLRFPSSLYSYADIPVFANRDELVLLVTPEVNASLNVDAYAQLFNVDRAEVKYRVVEINEFPIPNAVALLTTRDFYRVRDVEYMNTEFWNPQTLATNYYLHHWSINSVSPFVPAILYTTDDGTSVPVVTQSITSLNIAGEDTAAPGDEVQLTLTLGGDFSNPGNVSEENLEVAPDAATFSVSASTAASEGDPIQLNTKTYVDDTGLLHIQKTGLAAGNVLTVTAVSTYINPSGSTERKTATHTVTIS